MPNPRFLPREPFLERLAARAARRSSAASRGEISLLAGAGVVVWAFLTVTVLVSTPQALPLQQTQLAVGVGGGLVRTEAPAEAPAASDPPSSTSALSTPNAPTAAPTPPPATPTPVVAAGPPPSSAKSAPSTPAPTPRTTATPVPSPAPPVAPPALPVEPPAATPAATPTATPTPSSTPAPSVTPAGESVQVVGPNGTVITGPRGGPLNTRGADLYNCSDFTNFEQLIAVFIASGPSDPNHLDPQHTGSPCPPEDEQQVE
ncbi:MAG: hypothetical protein U0360_03480 [Dehalococcoidia bacterium]